jgi:hypothetical protein
VLRELRRIHDELREAIARLASVVQEESFEEHVLAKARLNLSRSSGRRRALIQCTIAPALHDVDGADGARLKDLLLEDAGLMVNSSRHVARWTIQAIREDWAGYQQASAAMRAEMIRRIEREAEILYPLLERGPEGAAGKANPAPARLPAWAAR